MKTAMDNGCKYLEIEDVTSYQDDVFHHHAINIIAQKRIRTYPSEFFSVTNVLSIRTDKLT